MKNKSEKRLKYLKGEDDRVKQSPPVLGREKMGTHSVAFEFAEILERPK